MEVKTISTGEIFHDLKEFCEKNRGHETVKEYYDKIVSHNIKMISLDKACKWIEENFSSNTELSQAFANEFRNAMEE